MQSLALWLCKCRSRNSHRPNEAFHHPTDNNDEEQPSTQNSPQIDSSASTDANPTPPSPSSSFPSPYRLTRRLSHSSTSSSSPSPSNMWGFGRSAAAPPADPTPTPADPPSSKPALSPEEMRAQRVRKLEQQVNTAKSSASSPSPSTTPPPASSAPRPIPRPETTQTPPSKPISSSASPTSHLSSSLSPAPSTRPQLRSSASTPSSAPSTSAVFSVLPSNLQPSLNLPLLSWLSELILDVLSVSIDKHKVTLSTRHRTFLAEAAREAAAAGGGERVVTLDQLDSLIIERLSLPMGAQGTRLGYLLSAYKKVGEVLNGLHHIQGTLPASYAASLPTPMFLTTSNDVTTATEACEQVLARVIGYCCIVLTDDELDPSSTPQHTVTVGQVNEQELLRLLFSDPLLSRTLPPYFLDYVCKFTDSEQLAEVFNPIISQCSAAIQPSRTPPSDITFESAKGKVQALATLAKCPPLATLIVNHRSFIPRPPQTGRSFQLTSLLGIHLSHLTSPQDPMLANIREKTQSELDADFLRQQADYGAFHGKLVDLLKALIKEATNRERVIQFFTTLFTLNMGKRKSYHDPHSMSTDSVFFTSLIVLLKLSLPIVKKNDMGSVRLEYAVANEGRLSYEGSTRLAATAADVLAKRGELREASYNFSTECFFLTHECLHLLQPLFRMYLQIQQKLQQMQQQLRQIDRSSESGERQHEHMQGERDQLLLQLFAINAHLLDPAFHIDLLTFLDYTAHLIHHHITQGTAVVHFLPESLLECLIDYYIFLGRFCSPVFSALTSTQFTYFPALMTTLAAGPHALKNPHLRSKLPQILQLLFLPQPQSSHGPPSLSLSYLFDSSPAFLQHLMSALIDLYVEIEFGDRMFFPKFQVRYEITMILEHLYTLPHYKQQLIALSKDLTHFLAFTNALANDLVYLFDEGLKCLSRIKEMQAEQETEAYQRLPESLREEKERESHLEEQHCTSYLQLASSTIHLLSVLTGDIVEPFTTHRLDFVSRFATTLTYYINKLVGPHISQLKVQHKERFHFAPRVLLKEMIVIFLHLSSSTPFMEKVASDERSYTPAIFDRAYSIMKRREILDPPDLRLFNRKKNEIELIHSHLVDFNASLGDVPEIYLDALTAVMMTDPVRLPTSKQIVDRVTIQRHLMNSRTDPFNRSELKEEELIEETKLKEEIDGWMREKKEEWLAGLKREKGEGKEEEAEEDVDMKAEEGKEEVDMI